MDKANLIDRKRYDVVVKALELACDELKKCSLEIRDDNKDLVTNIIHNTTMGYYLKKAEYEIFLKDR